MSMEGLKGPGRPCTICSHPQRSEIDQALLAGQSFRDIAGHFKVSLGGLSRHKAMHMQDDANQDEAAYRQRLAEVRDSLRRRGLL